jgi:hypothetical protein
MTSFVLSEHAFKGESKAQVEDALDSMGHGLRLLLG